VRQIQFVWSVYAQPPDRVDFLSRISIAEPLRVRLRRLAHASEKHELRFQNTMIEALNHANQWRLHMSEAFSEDIIETEWKSSIFFLFLSEGWNIKTIWSCTADQAISK
jgi:hypothetical protein